MDKRPSTQSSLTDRELLDTALGQLAEDAQVYDAAIESFNTHLENHRDRRDLHDLPLREPLNTHPMFETALGGDRDALESVLATVLDRAHLDSEVRCHPRVYPIHLESIEHLEIARDQLVATLEDALRYLRPVD